MQAPASGPNPGTKFTTPFGKPASLKSFAVYNKDKGVCSAGFNTIVQPVASAGSHFQEDITSGKFQGIICPTTPTGSWRV